jgi:hypothetical protein
MSIKILVLLAAVVIILISAIASMNPTGTSADKGGCPHEGSNGNGNPNADCPTPTSVITPTLEPTPEPTPAPTPDPTPTPTPDPTATPSPTQEPTPTPSPTPVPGTDTKVVSVAVNSPVSGTIGVSFLVSGAANLHNNGPAASVLVDTTFTVVLSPGCHSQNAPTVTVLNRNLPASIPVQVTRNWNVICDIVSEHTFTVNVSTAISPGQAWVEANPDNNNGTGSDATTVTSPAPTPTPVP